MMPRNSNLWLPAWTRRELTRTRPPSGVRRLYFCMADHYEPYWEGASRDVARARVRQWCETYPRLASRHRDSEGRSPQHTFFYPEEEYDGEILDMLAGVARRGLGDVEVHLHHDHDTAESLGAELDAFKHVLHERHGLLRRDPVCGDIVYAFVHGNWALDNSRPDGRWCGVDNELAVLAATGCRVDMTMPSAPSSTQTRKVNSIYCAKGVPGKRKSHDSGRDVAVGDWRRADEVVLIQGPLTLNWARRKFGFLPGIENGEVAPDCPPTAERVRLWGDIGVSVLGAESDVFVKLHTHGAQPLCQHMLFNGGLETLWAELERQYRDLAGCRLHYVIAWEMYSKVRAITTEAICRESAA